MTTARTMFLTGASSGIGAALAMEFARRGYALALAARRVGSIEAMVPALRAAGAVDVLPIELDVTRFDRIEPAMQDAARALGRLDIVVANAGVGHVTPVGKGRLQQVRETIDVNLTGAIATIEAALPLLLAQGGGQVVGVTSVAGARGLPGYSAYGATKAGLHRYLQTLRVELAGTGVHVTELAPGFIDTPMNRGAGARPFVIPVEKGAALMARMIEARVGMRWVPVLPWTAVALLLKVVPDVLLQQRPREARR